MIARRLSTVRNADCIYVIESGTHGELCGKGGFFAKMRNDYRIFLTRSPDFATETFALHVNDYLTKLFTKERLTDKLYRVIEKRKKRLFVPLTFG